MEQSILDTSTVLLLISSTLRENGHIKWAATQTKLTIIENQKRNFYCRVLNMNLNTSPEKK